MHERFGDASPSFSPSRSATLSRIRIYPVKSLDGLDVSSAMVLPSGSLKFDRQFAIEDSLGKFINAKRTPQLHQIRIEFEATSFATDSAPHPIRIKLHSVKQPTAIACELSPDSSALASWLVNEFGPGTKLIENRVFGFPDDLDSPGPTVIAEATLTHTASWFNLSTQEMRLRLRTNLEADAPEPFWEDQLYRSAGEALRFRIGNTQWAGTNPCQRCVVPTRDALTGAAADNNFQTEFRRRREAELPPWAHRERFNHFYRLAINTQLVNRGSGSIKVGDTIEMID